MPPHYCMELFLPLYHLSGTYKKFFLLSNIIIVLGFVFYFYLIKNDLHK